MAPKNSKKSKKVSPATASRPLVRFAKSVLVAFVLAAVSAFGYLQFREFTAVPSVSGANFSLEYRKIPFDVPSVDFTFSTDLDPASITAESVKVSPALLGAPTLKDGNVVSFALTEKMKIGEKYAFSLSADIASKRGKKMDREATFEVEAVA